MTAARFGVAGYRLVAGGDDIAQIVGAGGAVLGTVRLRELAQDQLLIEVDQPGKLARLELERFNTDHYVSR